ncbi:hypothetical protein NE237_000753 [Protea cynaroides]|uniref:Xyloglucan endotransglucosylase/hydrolase n=1 Tax=Protea cynaroides TaxID=273540 RepID=A0A9Q0KS22_9MAGN|nr:hypothetical protein NE237_000753 [Protea cynaroides]
MEAKMELRTHLLSPLAFLLAMGFLMGSFPTRASGSTFSFADSCEVTGASENFQASSDGSVWSLTLTNNSGCGFQTKQRYIFGWFTMKIKLVGGDSAGVVTAYYMCSDLGAGPTRDELDFEFLGNSTGEPYLVQTNVFKNGTGNREMRHSLWFDPTEDYHSYSILWNTEQIVFFVDEVAIRVYKNLGTAANNFPNSKPMYIFSSIWDADNWATRGGLVKTNWTYAPFVSSYTEFTIDSCQWVDPYPSCVSTTSQQWWDQPDTWQLSNSQKIDYAWVGRNLVVYDYCTDTERFAATGMPLECTSSPSL